MGENKKEELETAKRDLDLCRHRLEVLQKETDEILHIVSHDLRAPLVNIQGFSVKLGAIVASLKQHLKKEASQETDLCVRFIQKSVEKMDNLIRGLLRVSKVGHKEEPLQENDLDQLLSDIQAVFDFQMKKEEIQFIKKKKFPKVWCRRDEINQVFSNLISNAINYIGPGKVRRIEIGFNEESDNYRFWIEDTGIGIEDKDKEKIFRIFERLQEVPVKGEGLGLSLVKKIVERHDGTIWVESYKNKGTTFYFTLPKRGKVG